MVLTLGHEGGRSEEEAKQENPTRTLDVESGGNKVLKIFLQHIAWPLLGNLEIWW